MEHLMRSMPAMLGLLLASPLMASAQDAAVPEEGEATDVESEVGGPEAEGAEDGADPESGESPEDAQAPGEASAPPVAGPAGESSPVPGDPSAPAATPSCGECTPLGTLPPVGGTGNSWWEWVRLKTGETYGGDFHGMRDGTLVIVSDNAGERRLSFADVWEFYSTDPVMLVTTDDVSHVGPARMTDNTTMVVSSSAGDVSIPKAEILSINPAAHTELSHWYFKAAVGLNLADASIDTVALSTLTRIRREDELIRLTINHDFNYGWNSNATGVETTTAHNQWGLAKLDLYASKLFYVTLASVNAGYDLLQNISFRVTPGAGVGFHVIDGGPDLDLELTANYQYTRFDSVVAGADTDLNGGGGGYRIYFDWDLTGWAGITLDHRGTIVYGDITGGNNFGQSSFRTQLIFDFDLGRWIDIDITGTHDRVIEPPLAADGTRPQADTWTLVAALGFEFDPGN